MVFRVASSGGSSGLVIGAGATQISGGTAGRVLFESGAPVVLSDSAGLTWNTSGAAGEGLAIAAGTAVGAGIAAFSLTRTNNNASVDTGVVWTFTDSTSAATFKPFQILGGAAGTTNLIKVSKTGSTSLAMLEVTGNGEAPATAGIYGAGSGITNVLWLVANGGAKWSITAGGVISEFNGDLGLSRIATSTLCVGTGAAGSFAGRLKLTSAIAAGVAIGSLNASPTAGEVQSVTDALAPVAGNAVAAGGAAKALVWYNGAQWTVIGV